MNNRIVAATFVGVLIGLAWFARPVIPDGASLGWYAAGWAIITAGVAALWSGSVPQQRRIRVLVLVGSLLLADVCWSQPRLLDLAVIVVAALVVSVFVVFQGRRPLLEYLWLLRFPLGFALVLACLPLIFEQLFPSFLRNLLVMRAVDLVIVTTLAVVVARAAAFSADLIVRFGSKRAHVDRWPGLERVTSFLVRSPTAGVLAIPLISATLARCTSPLWASLPLVLLGVALGECVVLAGRWIAALLGPIAPSGSSPSMPAHSSGVLQRAQRKHVAWAANARAQCEMLLQRQPEWIREGFCDSHGLNPGVATVFCIALTTLVVYVLGYFTFFPDNYVITALWEPPALAYVLILLMLLTWGLSAVSFFLDRFRVSTFLVLAAIPFVLFFVHDLDHYYALPLGAVSTNDTQRLEQEERREVRDAFNARVKHFRQRHPNREPVIVAVAASGGGITAALWTTTVLEGLQKDFGPAFADSLHFISSVSGGSVGSMYYVDGFKNDAHPKPGDAVRRASTSSLSAVAWGFAYPDFWRAFSLRHPHRWEIDRGWAMERRWAREIDAASSLSSWRNDALSGWRPPVAFNATVVETGERLVMSSLHLNTLPDDCTPTSDGSVSAECESGLAARTHFTLFGTHDLPVVSAARLSATFPFVSPIARARADDTSTAYHVADGGYYDNFGVVTLIEWARKLVRITPRPPRLLIVEIRQSDNKAYRTAPPKDRAGWTFATLGPLSTMLNVRESSQAARNDLDIELLTEWATAREWTVENVVFTLAQDSPMSWHLSENEINGIRSQWTACKARSDSTIARAWNAVRALFPIDEKGVQPATTTTVDTSACAELPRATTTRLARNGR
jgi:hypothetical protein